MIRKIREKIHLKVAKSPKKAVLVGIMLFNAMFILIASVVIALMSHYVSGLAKCTFWEALFRTTTMMMDAGFMESVLVDIGKAGVIASLVCLFIVITGMVFFSGTVIGYVTNVISDFIESKNNGKNKLYLSDHIVMINWNVRAAEIVNEFLYTKRKVNVVIFVPDHRDEIEEEIRNRLHTTLMKETKQVHEAAKNMTFFKRKKYLKENMPGKKITYVVREGDISAATDLDDICISKAKTVIILENEKNESQKGREKGNIQTVKTLIQVSEMTKANSDQLIMVEVTDEWTEDLVYEIIAFNGRERNILLVLYNRLVGRTNSQIAMMPELNIVYDTLFSNRGPHFISQNTSGEWKSESNHIEQCLTGNCRSIPLTVMETIAGRQAFFLAVTQADTGEGEERFPVKSKAKLKKKHIFRKRCVVIMGHNSNMDSLMEGFHSFREEWNRATGDEVLQMVMVDDEENLQRHNYYRDYPYVETIAADIYDNETINRKVLELSRNAPEETTVLILSDDQVEPEDMDADALTYLIYIQGLIRHREAMEPDFRGDRLDVIVEILNPKNESAVKNHGADQVIISNRYVSRVISQLSLGEAVFEFYADILTCNTDDEKNHKRKIIALTAKDFFEKIPGKCTAAELIRMVFAGSTEGNRFMLLGYIRNEKESVFFHGDQRNTEVELQPEDKLILFSNHGDCDAVGVK